MSHPRPGEQFIRELQDKRKADENSSKFAPVGSTIRLERISSSYWSGTLTASGLIFTCTDVSPTVLVRRLLAKYTDVATTPEGA